MNDSIWESFDAVFKTVHRQGRLISELEERVAELEHRLAERTGTPHRAGLTLVDGQTGTEADTTQLN